MIAVGPESNVTSTFGMTTSVAALCRQSRFGGDLWGGDQTPCQQERADFGKHHPSAYGTDKRAKDDARYSEPVACQLATSVLDSTSS